MQNHLYVFGYKNGTPPSLEVQIWARNAVDTFLAKILTSEQMQQRENIQFFRESICQVAEEIVDRYLQPH